MNKTQRGMAKVRTASIDQLYQVHCNAENKSYIYTKLAKMIGSKSDYVLDQINQKNMKNYFFGSVSGRKQLKHLMKIPNLM